MGNCWNLFEECLFMPCIMMIQSRKWNSIPFRLTTHWQKNECASFVHFIISMTVQYFCILEFSIQMRADEFKKYIFQENSPYERWKIVWELVKWSDNLWIGIKSTCCCYPLLWLLRNRIAKIALDELTREMKMQNVIIQIHRSRHVPSPCDDLRCHRIK